MITKTLAISGSSVLLYLFCILEMVININFWNLCSFLFFLTCSKPRWRLGNKQLSQLWKWAEDNRVCFMYLILLQFLLFMFNKIKLYTFASSWLIERLGLSIFFHHKLWRMLGTMSTLKRLMCLWYTPTLNGHYVACVYDIHINLLFRTEIGQF